MDVVDFELGKPAAEAPPEDEVPIVAAVAEPTAPDVEVPDEVGMPDAPQPCEATGQAAGESMAGGEVHEAAVPPHPAARSLLYDGRRQFAPVCPEHDEWAREQIADLGFEVDEVVEIQPGDDTEEVPA